MKSNFIYKLNILLTVIVFWSTLWFLYNRFIRSKNFHPMGKEVLHTPKFLSCAIPIVSIDEKKNKCENVKFDGWSIGHMLIYITIGMFLPGYWKLILFLSILCEIYEYYVGWRARWLLDPLANLSGYLIGQFIFIDLQVFKWLLSTNSTILLSIVTLLLVYLNRPAMIPNSQSFY